MADFTGQDLSGSRFERVDLTGADFRASDLCQVRFRGVDFRGVVMTGVEMCDVRIDGEAREPVRGGERPREHCLLGPAPLPLSVGHRHGRPEQPGHVAARPVGSIVPVGQVEDVDRAYRWSWTPADRPPGVLPKAVPDQVQSPLDWL